MKGYECVKKRRKHEPASANDIMSHGHARHGIGSTGGRARRKDRDWDMARHAAPKRARRTDDCRLSKTPPHAYLADPARRRAVAPSHLEALVPSPDRAPAAKSSAESLSQAPTPVRSVLEQPGPRRFHKPKASPSLRNAVCVDDRHARTVQNSASRELRAACQQDGAGKWRTSHHAPCSWGAIAIAGLLACHCAPISERSLHGRISSACACV